MDQPVRPGGTPADSEFSLIELANAMLRHWRPVVAIPLLAAAAAGGWALTRGTTYQANTTFMPQQSDGGSASTAASLAQQFGINLGSDRRGQTPQFYVDLLNSRTVLGEAVRSTYVVQEEDGPGEEMTLVEYFRREEHADLGFSERSAVSLLRAGIVATVTSSTGIIRMNVSVPNAGLAEQVAGRLLEILDEFNREVHQQRAREEAEFINGRLEEAQAQLLSAEAALERFLSQNREFRNSPELVFQHDRLQRQVAMRQDVYTALLRAQEQARVDAVRDTPFITVIDHSAGTAQRLARGWLLPMVLALMLGLALAVFLALAMELVRRNRERSDPQYQELRQLAAHTWEEMTSLVRWTRFRT